MADVSDAGRREYCVSRGIHPEQHCCLDMAHAISHPVVTPHMGPNRVLDWIRSWNEYRIPVSHDGYSSALIRFCPWCGKRLPESQQKEWNRRLHALGYDDPGEQELPEEFNSDAWWREA